MIKAKACAWAAGAVLLMAGVAQAQQEPGARAGSSYIPSTHTSGCAGLLCDGNDPERAPGAPPPPPCEGLLCRVSPYSMQRPVTASDVQRMQEEQARTAAATAPGVPEKPLKSAHRHRSKAKTAKASRTKAVEQKSAAARTPDSVMPAAEPR